MKFKQIQTNDWELYRQLLASDAVFHWKELLRIESIGGLYNQQTSDKSKMIV